MIDRKRRGIQRRLGLHIDTTAIGWALIDAPTWHNEPSEDPIEQALQQARLSRSEAGEEGFVVALDAYADEEAFRGSRAQQGGLRLLEHTARIVRLAALLREEDFKVEIEWWSKDRSRPMEL